MAWEHAYGQPSDINEAAIAIQQAVEMGYTFFDTTECYIGTNPDGTTAYNEELVGTALKPYRDRVRIASKFGVHHDKRLIVTDSHPKIIRKSIEGSLKRLGTDYLDLYYQHRMDQEVPAEEVAGVMSELIQEGKILHWGISEANEEYLRRAHAVCPVTCIENRYSMMVRWHEVLFPVLEELHVGYVTFSPLANGILIDSYGKGSTFNSDNYRSVMPQYQEEAYDTNKELLSLIRNLAKEKQATPAQISLAWLLGKKPYIVPIPGSRKVERILEYGGAADIELAAAEVAAIDDKLNHMHSSRLQRR